MDLLEAIFMLVAQLEEGRAEVENQYVRSVAREGNRPAQQIMAKVFEVCDRKWRGIGMIPRSGLKLREEFSLSTRKKSSTLPRTRRMSPSNVSAPWCCKV